MQHARIIIEFMHGNLYPTPAKVKVKELSYDVFDVQWTLWTLVDV